nr:TetR/AcrR family transcriptional regulator [Streptomyces sp. SID3343]
MVLIGDTAIRLLVERGMRGLTHRAVDESAGIPPGSTSYYARTRAALLELALARMTFLEAGAFAPVLNAEQLAAALPGDVRGIADLVAQIVGDAIADGRDQKIARYELALEATRRPELRSVYDSAGAAFRGAAVAMMAALGSRAPERHGRTLVAWCEGVMFDAIVGAGWASPPSVEDVRTDVTEMLRGMLSTPDPSDGCADPAPQRDEPDSPVHS